MTGPHLFCPAGTAHTFCRRPAHSDTAADRRVHLSAGPNESEIAAKGARATRCWLVWVGCLLEGGIKSVDRGFHRHRLVDHRHLSGALLLSWLSMLESMPPGIWLWKMLVSTPVKAVRNSF